jgi:DNA-binding NarL/FixJ family response regulator
MRQVRVCDNEPRECCVGDRIVGGAMTDKETAQRARAVAMKSEGFSLQEIGEELHLTSEQVREILRKEGMESGTLSLPQIALPT